MPVATKAGVKRRRGKINVDHKKIKKARIEAASFTSPEFKVLLKNPASQFLAFEKFNDYVESYERKTTKQKSAVYDLVLEYLVSSPECSEIFHLLADKDIYLKSEITHVLQTLESLLTGGQREECKERVPQAGDAICRNLAEGHLQKIFNVVVRGSRKAGEVALSLLTAVANHSSSATRLLYSTVPFAKEDANVLLNESGAARLRPHFIKLLLAILNNALAPVLEAILGEKGLLNNVLANLHTDSAELIEQVLTTFDSKILSNRMVSKTQRVRLFNETTIPQILQCYNLRKPDKQDKSKQKSLTKMGQLLRQQVCSFVSMLLSDQKKGITFYDPEYGQGEKNMNHVLSLVISKSILRSAYKDEQLEEVVVASLISRPDQLHRYCSLLNESALLAKNTDSWLTAANHVVKLMYSLPDFSHYVSPSSSLGDEMLCNIALALTCPPATTMKIFKHVLTLTEVKWRYSSLGLLLVVMKRARSVLETVHAAFDAHRFISWRSRFVERLMQLLPNMDSLVHCWSSTTKPSFQQEFLRLNFADRVLNILVLHLELTAGVIHYNTMPINVSDILQDIENMRSASSSEDNSITFAGLTVKALQMLAELGEEAGLTVMKTQKGKRSTLSRILELVYAGTDEELAAQAKHLLIQQLKQSSWFDQLEVELEVWFHHGDKLKSGREFMERVLQTLFNNPHPFLDQVYSAVSAVGDHAKAGRVAEGRPLPFSPMVTIALRQYSDLEEPDDSVQTYMLSCLSEILLLQEDPLPLAHLLSKHESVGLSGVAEVVLDTKQKKSKVSTLPPYNKLWNLFFHADKATLPSTDSTLSELNSDSRSQRLAMRCCLLALWHHQGDEGVAARVQEVVSAVSDKIIVCTSLLQSGLATQWYLSGTACTTTYVISRLCNTSLSAIQQQLSRPTEDVNACLQVFKERLVERVTSVHQMTEEMQSLTIQSLVILAQTYSTSQLVLLVQMLLKVKDLLFHTDYWCCLQQCTEALFSTTPQNFEHVMCRLEVIGQISQLEGREKYQIIHQVVEGLAPEALPRLTKEVLEKPKRCGQQAPDLLMWLIKETEDVKNLEPLFSEKRLKELMKHPIILKELLAKVTSQDEKSLSLFKPTAKALAHSVLSDECGVSEEIIVLLGDMIPLLSEQALEELFTKLWGNGTALENSTEDGSCLPFLMSLIRQLPHLSSQLFDVMSRCDVSKLSDSTVEVIGSELSSLSLTPEHMTAAQKLFDKKWKQFVSKALRDNLGKASWLKLIGGISGHVYTCNGNNTDLPAKQLLLMLTNHSAFISLIACHDISSTLHPAKGELLSLMLLLVKMSPEGCHADHYPILLGAYRATLTSNDRKLLHLMYLYEQAGVSTIKYRPYLWGSAGVSYYSIKQNLTTSLVSQPSVDSVIDCLDRQLLLKSAYNLPLHRELSSSSADVGGAEDETLYDPAFLLPLFAYVMRPDNKLNTRLLIDAGVITYVLCSFSSYVGTVRAAARFILHEFRQHLESSVYSETIQGLYILDLLKESIASENARVPPVIVTFIAKSLQLSPDEHMYRVCHNFLLIKPTIDLHLVPEFLRLFFSSSQQFAVERSWMLNLLSVSLRDDSDFRLYEKLNVFRILMTFSQSSMCCESDKSLVLEVINKACSLPTSHQSLIKYNVLGYVTAIAVSFPEQATKVLAALKVLISHDIKDKPWFGTFTRQLVATLISLLKQLRVTDTVNDLLAEVLYKALVKRRDATAPTCRLSRGEVDTILGSISQTCNGFYSSLVNFIHNDLRHHC